MTALNSEGLEKARCATDGCGRPATQRFDAGGVGSDHCDDCAEKIRGARPALPPVDGLEVVAELNRVIAEEAADFADAAGHAIEAGERPDLWDREVEVAVHTLSQASSVIAGLRSERITAERDAHEAYRKLQAAEARISSLEQANEALMRERTNLIETKREQVGRLAKERDETQTNVASLTKQTKMLFAKLSTGVCDQPERISSLEEENKRLREALGSACEHIEQLSELLKNHWIDCDYVFSISVHEADEFLAARKALDDHNG